MLIREARKRAYFNHDKLGRRMSLGQSGITCPAFDQRLKEVTILKAFLSVQHAFALVGLIKQESRVV